MITLTIRFIAAVTYRQLETKILTTIIIIHAEIKVTLSQKCCRGTVQTAVLLQSQQQ